MSYEPLEWISGDGRVNKFTAEEVAEVIAELDHEGEIQLKIQETIQRHRDEQAAIKIPDVVLNNVIERIIYFIDQGQGEFHDRVVRGMLNNIWTTQEWEDIIRDIVLTKARELGEDGEYYVTLVEQYSKLSIDEQNKVYLELTDNIDANKLKPRTLLSQISKEYAGKLNNSNQL